jgi:hypothetical protein
MDGRGRNKTLHKQVHGDDASPIDPVPSDRNNAAVEFQPMWKPRKARSHETSLGLAPRQELHILQADFRV